MLSLSMYEDGIYEPSSRVLEVWRIARQHSRFRTGIVPEGIDGKGIERKYWEGYVSIVSTPCEFFGVAVVVLDLVGIAYKVCEPYTTDELQMICIGCKCMGDVAAIAASAQRVQVTGL